MSYHQYVYYLYINIIISKINLNRTKLCYRRRVYNYINVQTFCHEISLHFLSV